MDRFRRGFGAKYVLQRVLLHLLWEPLYLGLLGFFGRHKVSRNGMEVLGSCGDGADVPVVQRRRGSGACMGIDPDCWTHKTRPLG